METFINFMADSYDPMVNYGPIITIIGFLGFYSVMILLKYQTKNGTKMERLSFLLLLIALIPNFFAHLSLAVVHGAWTPFIAEVVNITPVIIYLIINKHYLKLKKETKLIYRR